MPITVSDYVDVATQAKKLGLNKPSGLSLLPRNFDDANSPDELLYESSVATVRTLFRQQGIQENRIEKEGHRILSIQQNEFSLPLPIIFVSALLYSENPGLVTVALNVISSYATDFFKGIPRKKKVVLDVVIEQETGKLAKRVHYEGDVAGLQGVAQIVGKAFKDAN